MCVHKVENNPSFDMVFRYIHAREYVHGASAFLFSLLFLYFHCLLLLLPVVAIPRSLYLSIFLSFYRSSVQHRTMYRSGAIEN